VIAAGIGCRSGAGSAEILALLNACLAELGLGGSAPDCLASLDRRTEEIGLREAAEALGCRLLFFSEAQLAALADACATAPSERLSALALPPVAEAAALAAAGEGARLILPRRSAALTTCALAEGRGR